MEVLHGLEVIECENCERPVLPRIQIFHAFDTHLVDARQIGTREQECAKAPKGGNRIGSGSPLEKLAIVLYLDSKIGEGRDDRSRAGDFSNRSDRFPVQRTCLPAL